MAKQTFRDFAGAIMGGNTAAAGKVLEELLGLDEAGGAAAASHFQAQVAQGGPAFMGKAMGLRSAVAGGKDDEIGALLHELFGLEGAPLATGIATLRTP